MYEELIKRLRNCIDSYCGDCKYKSLLEPGNFVMCMNALIREASDAIEALSKMKKTAQQDERLTPKKPKVSIDTWVCPACGRDVEFQAMIGYNILFHGQHDYCPNCGQAIDWAEPPKEE